MLGAIERARESVRKISGEQSAGDCSPEQCRAARHKSGRCGTDRRTSRDSDGTRPCIESLPNAGEDQVGLSGEEAQRFLLGRMSRAE
jgi:hypothetical protein